MKKLIYFTIFSTTLLLSCNKGTNKMNVCLQNSTDATQKEAQYLATPSVANCNAWKSALEASLSSCDGVLSSAELQEIRDQLDDINTNGCP